MIKTLSVCLGVIALCYIGYIGHFYYQTFDTCTTIQSQQNKAPENPLPSFNVAITA